jgi:hypothetical protein
MSTIPAKETERNRDEPDRLNPACVSPANRPCDSKESLPLRLRRRRSSSARGVPKRYQTWQTITISTGSSRVHKV